MRFRRALVLASSLAACAPEPAVGRVNVYDLDWGGTAGAGATAQFAEGPPPVQAEERRVCVHEGIGPCTLTVCESQPFLRFGDDPRPPAPPRRLSAGPMTLSIDGSVTAFDEEPPGEYWVDLDGGIGAGTLVTLSAAGADVEAFTASFVAPGMPRLEIPERIDRAAGLTLVWEPPPGAPEMTLAVMTSALPLWGAYSRLDCVSDAASASLTIDAATLARLELTGDDLSLSATYRVTRALTVEYADVEAALTQERLWLGIPAR